MPCLRATRSFTSTSTTLQAAGISLALRVMCSAMMRRTGERATFSSSVSCRAGAAEACSVPRPSANLVTSSRVIRPPTPVPVTRPRSTFSSAARRRTAGEYLERSSLGAALAGAGGAGGGSRLPAGADVAEGADVAAGSFMPPPVGPTGVTSVTRYPMVSTFCSGPDAVCGDDGPGAGSSSSVSISAMGAPMGTVSPSAAMMRVRTPLTGEGTSMVTLSVTTSTSGSYFAILSPGLLSHWPMIPSTTDSPTWGRSMVMVMSPLRADEHQR